MSKEDGSVEVLSCLVCDEVLEAKDGKLIIVGMHGGIYYVPRGKKGHLHLNIFSELEVISQGNVLLELVMFQDVEGKLEPLEEFATLSDLSEGPQGAIGHLTHDGIIPLNGVDSMYLYKIKINEGDWKTLRRVRVVVQNE